jgi:hypothetical protein
MLWDTTETHRTEHFFASRFAGTRIISITRTGAEFQNRETMQRSFDELFPHVRRLDGEDVVVLLDLGARAPVVPPALDATFGANLVQLLGGFARVAIVVESPIGQLQMKRICSEQYLRAVLFSSDREALAWLRSAPLEAVR